MTNIQYLDEVIKESGKKRGYLADKVGISRVAFSQKCAGKVQFKADEIKILCKELDIKGNKRDAIFFA